MDSVVRRFRLTDLLLSLQTFRGQFQLSLAFCYKYTGNIPFTNLAVPNFSARLCLRLKLPVIYRIDDIFFSSPQS